MKQALQIAFRGIPSSEAIETKVRQKAEKLDQFYNRITACKIIVESPNQRHSKGKLFHVRIDVSVPGAELVVGRDPAKHKTHTNVYVAIRDAFTAMRRQLISFNQRRRGNVKQNHDEPQHGKVILLEPYLGYGFLKSTDGREIYFNKNSVVNENFDRLQVGLEVRFNEELGEQGPQASTVAVIGKEGKHAFG